MNRREMLVSSVAAISTADLCESSVQKSTQYCQDRIAELLHKHMVNIANYVGVECREDGCRIDLVYESYDDVLDVSPLSAGILRRVSVFVQDNDDMDKLTKKLATQFCWVTRVWDPVLKCGHAFSPRSISVTMPGEEPV